MQPEKQRKYKFSASIGGLFILFAVIGIITIISISVNFTKELMDNRRQKEMFEKMIQPVVMFDPAAFSSPTEIDMPRLLLFSMWSTLADERAGEYSRSEENQSLLVPASDVEASAKKLFGNQIELEHATFTDYETAYFFDEENERYEVPTSGSLYVYTPKIVSITKQENLSEQGNELYKLLVNYTAPDNAWTSIFAAGGEREDQGSKKHMIYVVEKLKAGWNLVSVEYPPQDLLSELPGSGIETVYEPPEVPTELPPELPNIKDDTEIETSSEKPTEESQDTGTDESENSEPEEEAEDAPDTTNEVVENTESTSEETEE